MNAIHRLQLLDVALQIDAVQTMMQGVFLVGLENDGLLLLVEAQHLHHDPFALGDLLQFFAVGIKEVKVVIAVLLTLHDELRFIPGQELDRMQGLYVFVGGLPIEFCKLFACCGIIRYQPAVVLAAIQLEHIDGLAVRAPGDIREIAVCRIASLQVDGLIGLQVIDPHRHFVRGHSRHRVFVGFIGGAAREDIHLRIVCHHALVHAVEGQSLAVRTPERAFLNTELIPVNTLSIDNLAASIGRELMLLFVGIHHKELVLVHISRRLGNCIPVVGCLPGDTVLPDNLLLFEVYEDYRPPVTHLNDRLVRVGERGIHQVTHIFLVVTPCPLVDFLEGEELFLLAGLGINGVALLHIGLYQLVTPPGQPKVLRLELAIIRTTEIQVLEGEKLFLGNHGRWNR